MLVKCIRGGVCIQSKWLGYGPRFISSRVDELDNLESLERSLAELPRAARVVVCGGGVVGAAVAYHLAKRGWGDKTILIEKEKVGAGSRWHASGLVGAFKPSLAGVRLAQSSISLLQELEARGRKTGWKQCGSLLLARTRDRMTVYRRMKSQSVSWGIPCEVVTPKRCQELWPMLNVDDVVGGLWIPGDGVGDPHLFCMALMREAVENGVSVVENCAVTAVRSKNDKVSGVDTTRGSLDCEYFVNCAGFWAREVGQLAKPQVKVPLLPCEHYYLHTKPIENLSHMTPVVRDPDGYIYLRERDGCILAGGFEPLAKPVYEEEIENAAARCVPEDWDHFHVLLQQLLTRVPALNQAVLHKLCNGLEAFSPDCKWIIGEAPEFLPAATASYYKIKTSAAVFYELYTNKMSNHLCGEGESSVPLENGNTSVDIKSDSTVDTDKLNDVEDIELERVLKEIRSFRTETKKQLELQRTAIKNLQETVDLVLLSRGCKKTSAQLLSEGKKAQKGNEVSFREQKGAKRN